MHLGMRRSAAWSATFLMAIIVLADGAVNRYLFAQGTAPPQTPPAQTGGRGGGGRGGGGRGGGNGQRRGGFPQFTRELASQDELVRGKSLYEAQCASCHAADL